MGAFSVSQLFATLLILFSVGCLAQRPRGPQFFQRGKLNFTNRYPILHHCKLVIFARAYSNSLNIRVLASISHEEDRNRVYDAAVVWTANVTSRNFRICVLESGLGTNGAVIVNWVSFQGEPKGALVGTVSFKTFTSGTQCSRVGFSRQFSSVPKTLATIRQGGNARPQDAMNMWIEDQTKTGFQVCVREVKTFDGKHENLKVDWLSFLQGGEGQWTYYGQIEFENLRAPLEKDNFAFCKVFNFSEVFFEPPVVLVTINHHYDSQNANSVRPEDNALSAWSDEVTNSSVRVCIKDMAGMGVQHDPVKVDLAVLGDLDPCINATCDFHAVCKAFGPYDPRCICVPSCPSYEVPVCSSKGKTYDNECKYRQDMCKLKANYTIYHPGDCAGFPSEKGRHQLHHYPSWAEAVCEEVPLDSSYFYPDKRIHVQVTVNHANFSDPSYVHEAVVAWVEEIGINNFTVCVTQAGRNERKSGDSFATVDWLAYQGAPEGAVSGEMDMPTWWTGTSCRTVSLPTNKFKSPPTVLVSAEHEKRGIKHDASSVWVEDVSKTSFKICVRELQNFDGAHKGIHIDWMAFEVIHRPLFREHGSVYFANSRRPTEDFNYAFCEDVKFTKMYNYTPEVLMSANHSSGGGNLDPLYNSISAWAEYVNNSGFRACVKELYAQKHDPLSVTYAVLPDSCEPGWSYYNGYCYFTSEKCTTWANASIVCRSQYANLAEVKTQEENVYIQRRHNGAKAWIGLNDIATEGLFTWVDGTPSTFTFWAQNQPNDFNGEDCVHTLGVNSGYKWNDVDCSSCHQYTCKKDTDECRFPYVCDPHSDCTNYIGGFRCTCHTGWRGPGEHPVCADINECSEGTHKCPSPSARCVNTPGSYYCVCKAGWRKVSDYQCVDINECSTGSYSCPSNSRCVNTQGSYRCDCNRCYYKSGQYCNHDCRLGTQYYYTTTYYQTTTYYTTSCGWHRLSRCRRSRSKWRTRAVLTSRSIWIANRHGASCPCS
ncbi:uncharacterized protein [Montipora capricornis]|uniref:uncharacterized protein n=1 Tax=Montipora capricornis TaxID=246305 RepID=UPI0035F1A872